MIGETIGNFRLVGRLGRGGMGEVYLGEQTAIGTKVAVKVLSELVSSDSEHLQRFFNEARAVSKIQHAGIVKIFDVGIHSSGHAYLVMEHLDGESLAARLKRVGRLPVAEIADVGKQIASVLGATHGAGVTHRDLKPDNIFLVPDRELPSGERVKILDFGIAKLSGTLAAVSPQTVGAMGTPAYMAPEQWGDASKVDWRADLYSLGCLAFEMACGKPPFSATTIAEACGKHLGEAPPIPSELVGGIPRELDVLIAELLEKKPDARPSSAAAVARRFEALAGVAGTIPASSLRKSPDPLAATMATDQRAAVAAPTLEAKRKPAKRRRARWPWLVLALVAGGGGAAAYVMTRGGRTPDEPEARGSANAAWCKLSSAPVFDGSSDRPVLLRYHFTPGQATEVTAISQTRITAILDGKRTAEDVTLTLEGTVVWLAAEGERFSARWKLSRIGIDRNLIDGKPGGDHFTNDHWSTDGRDPRPEYAAFVALKQTEILFAVDARGAVLDSNLAELGQQLERGGGDAAVRALFTADHLFRVMLPKLPPRQVKLGDTWRAGNLDEPINKYGTQSTPLELRVGAVSADGNQILITAAQPLRVDARGNVRVAAKDGRLGMWAQLDLTRHQIIAGSLRACTDMQLDSDLGHTDVGSELVYSYDAITNVASPPPPPPPDAAVAIDAGAIDAAEIDAAEIDAGVDDAEPPIAEATGAIGKGFEAAKDKLAACITGDGGKVTVRMKVGGDGRVTSGSATGLSGGENQCLGAVVRTLRFERKAGGPSFTVNVPLVVRRRQ